MKEHYDEILVTIPKSHSTASNNAAGVKVELVKNGEVFRYVRELRLFFLTEKNIRCTLERVDINEEGMPIVNDNGRTQTVIEKYDVKEVRVE